MIVMILFGMREDSSDEEADQDQGDQASVAAHSNRIHPLA
jgi:hypothetical protein